MLKLGPSELYTTFRIVQYGGQTIGDIARILSEMIANELVGINYDYEHLCITRTGYLHRHTIDTDLCVGPQFTFTHPVHYLNRLKADLLQSVKVGDYGVVQSILHDSLGRKNKPYLFVYKDVCLVTIAAVLHCWGIMVALLDAGCPYSSGQWCSVSPLYSACEARDSDAVRMLISRLTVAQINYGYVKLQSALHKSVSSGQIELVKILVDAGADFGVDLMDYATKYWQLSLREYLWRSLISRAVETELVDRRSYFGVMPKDLWTYYIQLYLQRWCDEQ